MKHFFLLVLTLFIGSISAQTENAVSPVGQRFDVDKVEMPSNRLNEMKAQDAFENELGKEIQFFPDELKDQTVVPGWGNCFVATIHKSFDEHRPLTLSPDVIWLTIAQGVSIHINENFEALESFIFKAQKPDKISVRNDDLADGSVHWVDLLHSFSDSTTKYVNDDYYSFFVPEFSTTTNIVTTSYEVTMLEGFSQAFEYFGDSGCGIPYITLQGTEDDWRGIYDRLDKIEELGMEVWATELRGVIQKFISVYHGGIDLDFWQNIYKDHTEYGASYVSGWFIKFFPYLEASGEQEPAEDPEGIYYSRAPKTYIVNPYLEGDRYLISGLGTDDFPSGISEIDVHWNNYGIDQEMKVHAGFYGIKQHDDLSLEPAISWAVCDKEGEKADHDPAWTKTETEHRHVYWSPALMKKLEELAIYNEKGFTSVEKSYAFVKEQIIEHIENNSYFSILKLKGKSVDLLISSNGTIIESRSELIEDAILIEITKAVHLLPKKWTPAKTDFKEFVDDYYDEKDDGTIILIPANSLVRIDF